jgi:hypothetical protein
MSKEQIVAVVLDGSSHPQHPYQTAGASNAAFFRIFLAQWSQVSLNSYLLFAIYVKTGRPIDEPANLFNFLSPKNLNNNQRKLTLAGVGVRVKQIGPIKAKVYSAAVYLDKGSVETKCKGLKCISEKELLNSKEFESTVRQTSQTHVHLSYRQHMTVFTHQSSLESDSSNELLCFNRSLMAVATTTSYCAWHAAYVLRQWWTL